MSAGRLGAILAAPERAVARPSSGDAPSIASALTPSGYLLASARGSFSADGYEIVQETGRAPRFVAATQATRQTAAGAYSGAFLSDLPDGAVRAVAVLSPTDFVVGGDFTSIGGVAGTYRVALWDGTAWRALGGGTNGAVQGLAVGNGGDIYVGGSFTQAFATAGATPGDAGSGGVAGTVRVARWDGTAWRALGGGLDGSFTAFAIGRGSEVYVGGYFRQAFATSSVNPGFLGSGGVAGTANVARWTGTAWQALGGGTDGGVRALAVGSGGDLYIAGQFTQAFTTPGVTFNAPGSGGIAGTLRVARWDGAAWQALGGGVDGTVYAIAVGSGGEVYVGGLFWQAFAVAGASPGSEGTSGVAGTTNVARWTGSAWQALGGGVGIGAANAVNALAVGSGGEVYVGGQFWQVYATAGARPGSEGSGGIAGTLFVARWSEAQGWQSLGGGLDGTVNAFAVGSSGEVYVGGIFAQALATAGASPGTVGSGGVAGTFRVARWDGSAWQTPGGIGGNGPDNRIHAIAVLSPTEFVVGGDFTSIGGVAGTSRVARWDGSAWQPLGGGVNGIVYALAVANDGDLYVGGSISRTYTTPGSSPNSVGSGSVAGTRNVARWDGTAWHALGGGVDDRVYALAIGNAGEVYVGGSFFVAYLVAGASPGAVGSGYVNGTRNVARWTGTSWQALGGGMGNGEVNALAVGNGGEVYVGGSFDKAFTTAGTNPFGEGIGGVAGTRGVARWSAARGWQALAGGVDGGVLALAAGSGGDVYVGGRFSQANATVSTGFGTGSGVAGTINVARWDGTAWHALGGGVGNWDLNGRVSALAVGSRGEVYVGGVFMRAYATANATSGAIGTSPVTGTVNLARWSAAQGWQSLAGGVPGPFDLASVQALTIGQAPPASPGRIYPTAGPVTALFVGGSFTSTGDGTAVSNLTYYTEGDALATGIARVPANRSDEFALTILGNAGPTPRLRIDALGSDAPVEVTVEVIDVLGRQVHVARVGVSGRREMEMDASLAAGVYAVRVATATTAHTTTLVVR